MTSFGPPTMNQIREGIYLGSARDEASPLETLQEAGISHVVQVGSGDFMSPTHTSRLSYCCVRALDFEGEDLLQKIKAADIHKFVDDALRSGGKVLVHCFAGVSRSSTTVISYLMAKEGITFEDALVDLISKRDCVAPNRGFCNQLRILQDQCGGQLDNYKPEMLRDQKEELSVKQWLALLMRAKDKARTQSVKEVFLPEDASVMIQQGPCLNLAGFKQRLEERKRLAQEGKYEGVQPPPEVQDSTEEEAAPKSSAEEYSLELA